MAEADPRPASERLLDRTAPPGYLEAWARALAATPAATEERRSALALFRLGEERFGIDAAVVREVHAPRRVHRLPGRTNDVLRGLVVLRGEVHLCVDLHALLGCKPGDVADSQAVGVTGRRPRMVVIARGTETWAFAADDVLDVRRIDPARVAPTQVTVAKASVHFSDGLLALADGPVARLDPERLFLGLMRSLS